MDVSNVEVLEGILKLVELALMFIAPVMMCGIGYKLGWKDAKEQSFRMTRSKHRNKLRY